MKKIFYILSILSALTLTSCDLFEMDTFDGPDAQITGRLIDSETGENIQVQASSETIFDWGSWPPTMTTVISGGLTVVELGWDGEAEQNWSVKFNGDYTNNMVFAGKYRVSSKNLPCFDKEEEITIKEGANKVDFTYTPYCRIVDEKFSYDAATKKVKATFKVEPADPELAGQITRVVLCANTSNFVGTNLNLCANDPGASAMNVPAGETVTLEIDTTLPANNEQFKYERTHFLRIGALCQGMGQNTNNSYNFTPVYTMSRDFSTFAEYDWSTAN